MPALGISRHDVPHFVDDAELMREASTSSQSRSLDGSHSLKLPGFHRNSKSDTASGSFHELLRQLAKEHERAIDEQARENANLRFRLLAAEARQPSGRNKHTDTRPNTELALRHSRTDAPSVAKVDEGGVNGSSSSWCSVTLPCTLNPEEEPSEAESATPMSICNSERQMAIRDAGFALRSVWKERRSSMLKVKPTKSHNAISAMASEHSSVQAHSGFLRHFISFPGSHFRVCWDLFGAALIFYDLFLIPMRVFNFQDSLFIMTMDWVTLVFWSLNVFMSFLVGYVKNGVTIMVPWKILVHYVRTWFMVDLLVIVPDWVFTVASLSGGSSAEAGRSVRLLRIMRLMRAIRLLRILKLRWILISLNDRVNSEYSGILWSIFKMIVLLLSTNHLIACAWFLVADLSRGLGETWVSAHEFEGDDWFYQYLTAFHWSITQFTPASMSVQPQNVPERLFTIIIVVFALVGFSYVVGSITGSLTQIRSMHEDAAKQFWNVRVYLRQNKVPLALSLRIQKYLEHAWQKQRHHLSASKIKLFSLLSEQLHNELYLSMSVPHLSIHPLFCHLKDESSITMNRLSTTAISRKLLAQHDSLFYAGEAATHMYFVIQGRLQYVRVDSLGNPHTEQVDKGEDWISEPVLWTPAWVHLGVLNAETECDLLLIDAEKFSSIIRINPDVFHLVSTYAKLFVMWINSRGLEHLSDIVQGEDASDTIKGFIVQDDSVENTPCTSSTPAASQQATDWFHLLT